jgi:hypothetical protein
MNRKALCFVIFATLICSVAMVNVVPARAVYYQTRVVPLSNHVVTEDASNVYNLPESGETVSWKDLWKAKLADSLYSTATSAGGGPATSYSYWLAFDHFGFAIPSGATILGIGIIILRYGTVASDRWVVDDTVKLFKGAGSVSDNRAKPGAWSQYPTYIIYGGTGDFWGLSWTPADINSPYFSAGFSVALWNLASSSMFKCTAYLEFLYVGVTYAY